jgi:hypothetical protein
MKSPGLLAALFVIGCSDTTTELVGRGGLVGDAGGDAGCVIATCAGKVFECGNCIDDDEDGQSDSDDLECLGACDNTEDAYFPDLPGDPGAPCRADCFWDVGNGAGNDQCVWDHRCDPLEKPPNFPPEGPSCAHDPSLKLETNVTCTTAFDSQAATCLERCLPLTPNGCDCFGCCILPNAPTPVWMGAPECTAANVADPSKCPACTLVPSCSNACEDCEVCVDKGVPASSCSPAEQCANGARPCGLPGMPGCSAGTYCITGCCVTLPS